MSVLYIIATPIGNLSDISQRALDTLQRVDFILCEDTRHTLQLLNYFNIKKPLIAYHQHSQLQKTEQIISLLRDNKNLALVCDAGTPGIADPGGKLVEEVIKALPHIEVVPIPGACALIAALSISGFPTDKFLFLGFPPVKKGRKKFFDEVVSSKHTVVFYESCYRILRTLKELGSLQACKEPSSFHSQMVVCRELTKKFETIYRGTCEEVAKKIESDKVKGEFVVVVRSYEK